MASTAVPMVGSGGTSASMWANQPGPPRSGKTSEAGSTFRGSNKGAPRGRGGRGGGRGGRSTNGKSSATSKPEATSNKPTAGADQPQEKSSSDPPKSSPQPPSTVPVSQPQTTVPSKQPNRTKPTRRNSEQKGSRKGPTLAVDPSVTSTSNTSSSPSVSPNTPSRRKRGNSKASAPPAAPAVPIVPRKQSVTQENGARKEKPPPSKDLPPHLASPPPPPPPPQPTAPFDIKHDIDALVERVRAVAMDRPHTPGSHIDWAGEDDDSLPDLDDWGVPSTITATSKIAPEPQKVPENIISPILQDTLKPLPMIDIDIPTPSIRLHEVGEDVAGLSDGGDETPRETVHSSSTGPHTPPTMPYLHSGSRATPVSTKSDSDGTSPRPSSSPSPTKPSTTFPSNAPSVSTSFTQQHSEDVTVKDSSPSPERHLTASIHAMPSSLSAPNHFSPRPPRGGFNPAHGRSQTVGRMKPEHHSDNDRPRRGTAFSHGRNHSTPPTGPGTAHAHARAPHATRPVISVDAISRLARTLGGASAPRKPKEATPAPSQAA